MSNLFVVFQFVVVTHFCNLSCRSCLLFFNLILSPTFVIYRNEFMLIDFNVVANLSEKKKTKKAWIWRQNLSAQRLKFRWTEETDRTAISKKINRRRKKIKHINQWNDETLQVWKNNIKLEVLNDKYDKQILNEWSLWKYELLLTRWKRNIAVRQLSWKRSECRKRRTPPPSPPLQTVWTSA